MINIKRSNMGGALMDTKILYENDCLFAIDSKKVSFYIADTSFYKSICVYVY